MSLLFLKAKMELLQINVDNCQTLIKEINGYIQANKPPKTEKLIRECNFCGSALNIFYNNKINTIQELLEMGEHEIMKLHLMGHKTMRNVKSILQELGYELKE